MTAASPLDAALRYAAAGWPVFSCQPGRKTPFPRTHGFEDATIDPEVIRRWWKCNQDANVAIATGAPGPDVLDIDIKPDGDGFAALGKLKNAGLLGGARALVRTRSGGLHIYYAGTTQGCHALPRHRIDFKARGGYVIAPPSFVEADEKGPGGRYELLDHRAGTAAIDWTSVITVLDPTPAAHLDRPARPLPPGELPPAVLRALAAPASDRSKAVHHLVGACVRAGLDAAATHEIVANYPPAVDKYGSDERLHKEIDRSLRKIGGSW
jgi:hypothetical protein